MRVWLRAMWLALAACASDDDDLSGNDDPLGGESCTLDPCGGSPIGAWTVTGACMSGAEELIVGLCAEATLEREVSVAGDLTVDAGGTFVLASTADVAMNLRLPDDCMPDGDDCQDLGAQTGASCNDAANGCACELVVQQVVDATGEWQQRGDELALTGSGLPVSSVGYCVAGDTLQIAVEVGQGVTLLYTLRRR